MVQQIGNPLPIKSLRPGDSKTARAFLQASSISSGGLISPRFSTGKPAKGRSLAFRLKNRQGETGRQKGGRTSAFARVGWF